MESEMTFQSQAETFMSEIAHRKSDPVRTNTLHVYRSLLDARILPAIGGVDMTDVNNKTAKLLVGRLTEAHLSPATISLAVSLVKQIVKSAVDEDGNQLYPRTWNTRFIDAPRVDPQSQKAPLVPTQTLQEALGAIKDEIRGLIALLAGTGLRVGEALALSTVDNGVDNLWDPEAGTLPVDLDPSLNALLRSLFAECAGRLFPASETSYRRQINALGIPGFHSLRRFRITQLQGQNVPTTLIKFWAGHAAGDITERYTKIGSQIEERKSWSERAGLGFNL